MALAWADAILPQLRESGNRLFEHDVLAGQAVALDERGENALAPAERALEIAARNARWAYLAFAAWAAAPVLIAAGRTGEAKELIGEVADSSRHEHSEYANHLPRLARAAAALGDDDLLARLAAGFPEVVPRQQHALVTVRAIQAERAGEGAEAAALYADAADRWERLTEVIEQAHALLGHGRCLTAVGDPGADSPLRRARALFDQMGARRRVDECDTLIARASKLTSYMPYAVVNGLTMYYEVHGDGSPLLLLHGGGSSIPEKWIPFFTSHFRVIAPEASFGRLGLDVRPALINGVAGWASLREGEVFAVAAATVQDGRITALHILIDPVRLSQLNLTSLDLCQPQSLLGRSAVIEIPPDR